MFTAPPTEYPKIKTERVSKNRWKVLEDYTFFHPFCGLVTIPEGFITDYASVPWGISFIIRKRGRHGTAAVIHDYLYYIQICSRQEADYIMGFVMKEHKVSKWKRDAILAGLYVGGWTAWNNHKKRIKKHGRTWTNERKKDANSRSCKCSCGKDKRNARCPK